MIGPLLEAVRGWLAGPVGPALVGIAALGAGTLMLKAAGPVIGAGRALPRSIDRLARALPAALLAALTVAGTVGAPGALVVDARLAGVVGAGIALWRRAPFAVVVLVGAAVTAVTRAVGLLA
jgi:branched-subunit amino acid transport protein